MAEIARDGLAEQKAEMAHRRLDEIERMILLKGHRASNREIETKIAEFERFKTNAEVELRAIKEVLAKMRTEGADKKDLKLLSDEELHKLVFRSN